MNGPDIADTPAGRQLRWWLAGIDDPDSMHAEDVIRRYKKLWPNSEWFKGDVEGRQAWKNNWERFGEFTIEAVESPSDYQISVVLAPATGRRQKITFWVEEDPPHRIRMEQWGQVYDFDLAMKEATPDDAPILADIERRAPVVAGDLRVVTDRGEDYFAAARLIENVTVFLAAVDGDPAGVAWGATAPVCFQGTEAKAIYFFHLRVVPEHQGKGLWGAFDGAVFRKYGDDMDFYLGYYMAENVVWSHVADVRRSQPDFIAREWVPTVYRLLLPIEELAGPTAGRVATPADAGAIADILNEFHEGEEFYLPYTEHTIAARLERDLSYSWDRVLISDGAVLGVWPAGDTVAMITERDGERTTSRRGHVMDYGFRAGAEQEFLGLMATASASLKAREIDTLSIFTSRGARGQPVLKEFDCTVEAYRFNTGTSARIADSARESGIYTDHRFF